MDDIYKLQLKKKYIENIINQKYFSIYFFFQFFFLVDDIFNCNLQLKKKYIEKNILKMNINFLY